MKNIIKRTIISLSVVSLIMIGFSSFAFAELRPFEHGKASTCELIKAPVTAQLADEINAGLASEPVEKVLICSAAGPGEVTQQINNENMLGGR